MNPQQTEDILKQLRDEIAGLKQIQATMDREMYVLVAFLVANGTISMEDLAMMAGVTYDGESTDPPAVASDITLN